MNRFIKTKAPKIVAATVMFLLLFLLVFGLLLGAPAAYAELDTTYKYIQIPVGDALMTTTLNGDNRIDLPATYFVEVTAETDTNYTVRYAGITGTITKAALTGDYCTFEMIGTGKTAQYTANVILQGVSGYDISVHTKSDFSGTSTVIDKTQAVTIYGTFGINIDGYNKIYFVSATDKSNNTVYGYIHPNTVPSGAYSPGTLISGVDVTITTKPTVNPGDPADPNADGNGDGTTTDPAPETEWVKIVLIVIICVLAILIVFIIFKPVKGKNRYQIENKPKKRGKDKYEFDDEEDDF